jgi:hypothetical protein
MVVIVIRSINHGIGENKLKLATCGTGFVVVALLAASNRINILFSHQMDDCN